MVKRANSRQPVKITYHFGTVHFQDHLLLPNHIFKRVINIKIQVNIDWSREKFSLVGSKPDWAGIERVSRLIRREHSTFSIYSSHVDPVVSLSTLIKTAPHIQTSKSLSQERSYIIKSLIHFRIPKIGRNLSLKFSDLNSVIKFEPHSS